MKTLKNYYVTISKSSSHYTRQVIVKSCVSETSAVRVAHLKETNPGETAILAYQISH